MKTPSFAYIWRFTIDPRRRQEFLAAYGPDGHWAQLFARDASYIRTELLRDAGHPDQYLTIDYWVSQAARDAFRATWAEPFAALDARCESFTLAEEFVGDFSIVP